MAIPADNRCGDLEPAGLVCFSCSHRVASLALREDVQRGLAELMGGCRPLPFAVEDRWRLLEWVQLVTCGRVELYASIAGSTEVFEHWLTDRLARTGRIRRERLREFCSLRRGDEVTRHLFEVASGLDSLILGEPEVLGQVRRAAAGARVEGTLGNSLAAAFQRAVRAGRRVRRETELGQQDAGIGGVAVERAARSREHGLQAARVLVIGLGEVGKLVLEGLRARGVDAIGVVNRREALARRTARERVRWWPISEVASALGWADVVFACVASAVPVVSRAMAEGATRGARSARLLIVDLGMPRNVDPSCVALSTVELLTLEDLVGEAPGVSAIGQQALVRAREILKAEQRELERELCAITIEPAIRELRLWSDAVRCRELERLRGSLGDLDGEIWDAIRRFSRSLTDKLLHLPTTRLREAAGSGEGAQHLEALRRLFDAGEGRPDERASA